MRPDSTERRADVVVVGGGIAGASLAFALAREGLAVTVLEASAQFTDRVRGETMQPWGVNEARALGVEQVLLDAGAHIAPVLRQYVEGMDAYVDTSLGGAVTDVDGALNLAHPVACAALLDAARAAGASVVRGVDDVVVSGGSSPRVSCVAAGSRYELEASLVVGADGRASAVRKQAGVTLQRQEPISCIAGLLVEGLDDVPAEFDAIVAGDDVLLVLFHQGRGRARVYVCAGVSGLRRFSGPARLDAFLEACASTPFPWSASVAGASPAGPVKVYPGEDTWTAEPYADGVVLVGDAAGYNDPILAQGLSIALRDVRIVRDLILDGARSAREFAPFGEERSARMRRLRFVADVIAIGYAEDADNKAARRRFLATRLWEGDAHVQGLFAGAFAGPELVPEDLLRPELLERMRSL